MKYTKTEGKHCWWLNSNGKAIASFDNEQDVDEIIKMEEELDSANETLSCLSEYNYPVI